jgi:hypothetical protein
MGIRTEYQAVITCDVCLDNWVEGYTTQQEAIKNARRDGWTIGKVVKCPKCKEAKSNER